MEIFFKDIDAFEYLALRKKERNFSILDSRVSSSSLRYAVMRVESSVGGLIFLDLFLFFLFSFDRAEDTIRILSKILATHSNHLVHDYATLLSSDGAPFSKERKKERNPLPRRCV